MFLADKKKLMVIISGSMHLANIIAINVGAQLYISGGWLLTGFAIAVFDIIPIFFLPFIGRMQRKIKIGASSRSNRVLSKNLEVNANGMILKEKPSKIQKIVFFVPDIAAFLNNSAYVLLLFAIPTRIKEFTGKSLGTAVLFNSLMVVFSFASSMTLGFVAGRRVRPNFVMLIGNAFLYIGMLLAFGSTTEFLAFPASFEIGSVFIGIGNAAVVNIAVMSKFSLYEKWGVKTDGNLAERSTAVFNFSISISQAVGIVLSGLVVTRASEVPTIVGAVAACLFNTVGFILCILVK